MVIERHLSIPCSDIPSVFKLDLRSMAWLAEPTISDVLERSRIIRISSLGYHNQDSLFRFLDSSDATLLCLASVTCQGTQGDRAIFREVGI